MIGSGTWFLGYARYIPNGGWWTVCGLASRPICWGHKRNSVRKEDNGSRNQGFLRGGVLFVNTPREPSTESAQAGWAFAEAGYAGERGVVYRKVLKSSLAITKFGVIKGVVYVEGYEVVDSLERPCKGGVQRMGSPLKSIL